MDRPAAYELLRTTAVGTLRRSTQAIVGMLTHLRPAHRAVAWVPDVLIRGLFGAGVVMERRDQGADVEFLVTMCAFRDFFARTEEPGLVRVVCELDRNWINPALASGRVEVSRPLAMSMGDEVCQFLVQPSSSRSSNPVDVVIDNRRLAP